jgi:hypothetical protein
LRVNDDDDDDDEEDDDDDDDDDDDIMLGKKEENTRNAFPKYQRRGRTPVSGSVVDQVLQPAGELASALLACGGGAKRNRMKEFVRPCPLTPPHTPHHPSSSSDPATSTSPSILSSVSGASPKG